MPLSGDAERRAAQLANLRPGSGAPPSNRRAVAHGGYATVARERLEVKEREVFDALAADAPLRENDHLPAADHAQVRLLATVLCRIDDVMANVRDFGMFDSETGGVRPAVDLERRLRREAADYLDALGMTPRSRAKLGVDVARASPARAVPEMTDADGKPVNQFADLGNPQVRAHLHEALRAERRNA